jgi:hypothetical protein
MNLLRITGMRAPLLSDANTARFDDVQGWSRQETL